MDSGQLDTPKVEKNPHEFDWFSEESSHEVLELPPLDSFFEFDPLPLPYNTKQLSLSDFQDFEDLDSIFFLAEHDLPFPNEDVVVEQRPANSIINCTGYFDDLGNELSESLSSMIIKSECASSNTTEEEKRTCGRKKSATVLELDEIQRHFDVPITKAAREMNVGLTVLKKRCRELNILRWPHRKIKSLKSLIDNVKELGLSNEVVMLEEHKRLLEKLPDVELTEGAKKLRQACFKANYKKRRSLAIQA